MSELYSKTEQIRGLNDAMDKLEADVAALKDRELIDRESLRRLTDRLAALEQRAASQQTGLAVVDDLFHPKPSPMCTCGHSWDRHNTPDITARPPCDVDECSCRHFTAVAADAVSPPIDDRTIFQRVSVSVYGELGEVRDECGDKYSVDAKRRLSMQIARAVLADPATVSVRLDDLRTVLGRFSESCTDATREEWQAFFAIQDAAWPKKSHGKET